MNSYELEQIEDEGHSRAVYLRRTGANKCLRLHLTIFNDQVDHRRI